MSNYDSWKAGDFDRDDETELDSERVDELTDKLIDQRIESPRLVGEAIDELSGTSDHNSDGNTHFAADLAAAVMGGEGKRAEFFAGLEQKIRDYLSRDASTDAADMVAREMASSHEMRDMQSQRWAA